MLKTIVKYSLPAVIILGLSACSSARRTITIGPETVQTVNEPRRVTPVKRPDIKEEILLGRDRKNPNASLGSRVDVPVNNPSLGEVIDTEESPSTESPVVPVTNQQMERIPFPVSEYRQLSTRGRSTVSGRIFLENSHTSVQIKGKKIKLWLNPVTSYSRQWYEESYLGGYKLSKTDKRLYKYLKFTYSDNSGQFNFFGVPTGNYYLTGSISCAEECGYSERQSIRLVREISVGRGVTTVDLMKHVP